MFCILLSHANPNSPLAHSLLHILFLFIYHSRYRIFYSSKYIFYLPALIFFSFSCIFLTSFIQKVYCLSVYSLLCSFDHFSVYSYVLILHIFFLFQNTPVLSPTILDTVGDSILLLFILFDDLGWLCVIHSNICLLYKKY